MELRGSDPAAQAALIVTALGDGRILQASDGFAELSGYRRDELLGRSTLELGLWRDSADRDRALQRLAAQGGRGTARFVLRRRDGTTCEVIGQVETVAIGGEQVVVTALEMPTADLLLRSMRENNTHSRKTLTVSFSATSA